jgi:TetR/AcrR family transcriptional repressor of mexJK operon
VAQLPGRPKDATKRAAILGAARGLFARLPFEQVTMEAVAAQAGVSKMTVYSHFHDKETLFEAFIGVTTDAMISALPATEAGGDLRERLVRFGTVFLGVVVGPEFCTVAHLLPVTLSANRPLAERFHAAGPRRVRDAVAAVIAEAAGHGELTVDDPCQAADDLICLWRGDRPDLLALGLAEPAGPEEARRLAEHGTSVFLRAYAREG